MPTRVTADTQLKSVVAPIRIAWGMQLLFTVCMLGGSVCAEPLNLPSEVIAIPKKILLGTLTLETTVYKPPGDGPFPLVIINHGKASGPPGLQARYQPVSAARYFVERNYVVFVPMRSGFSKSTGSYVGGGCNIESNGLVQAEDVATTLAYAHTLPYVDNSRSLIVGQSHGGWTALAYGAINADPSVKGVVNFAGGLRQEQCSGWRSGLVKAVAEYGQRTKVPSLWLYGDNDSYFSPDLYNDMFENYRKGNRDAELIAYGTFGSDSHALFSSKSGRAIWEPYVEKFLTKVGLPTDLMNPQFKEKP